MRLPEVERRVGLRHSTIYSYMNQGRFPKRIKITRGAVGWLEFEIEAWMANRVKRSRALAAQVDNRSHGMKCAGDLRLVPLPSANVNTNLNDRWGVATGKERGVVAIEITLPQGYEALWQLCPEEDRDSLETFHWPTNSMELGREGDGTAVALYQWPDGVEESELALQLPEGLAIHAGGGLIPVDPSVLHGVRLEEVDTSGYRIADGEQEHAAILQFPKCLSDYVRSNAVKAPPKRPPLSEAPAKKRRKRAS
jgi:prophage regulatory protein